MDFGKMQRVVYDFVISQQTEMVEYSSLLAESTDQFWVPEFDDLLEACEESSHPDMYIDQLANAVEAVNSSMIEFYQNPWNHPPGYKPISLKTINVTDAMLDELSKKLEALK